VDQCCNLRWYLAARVIRPIYAMESYIRRKPVLEDKEENCRLQGTSAHRV
jgi:hypothetical protein